MKVDIRIDPACGEPAVTITAPALTDEIKALAARLEGGAALVGWDGARAVRELGVRVLRIEAFAGRCPWRRRTSSAAMGRRRGSGCRLPAGCMI